MSLAKIQAGDFIKPISCKEEQLNQKLIYNNRRRTINQNSISSKNNYSSATLKSVDANNSDQQQDHLLMMSDDAESMFIIGSIVNVETGWGHSFEGEVIAFDYKYKILLLKCSALSGNTTRNDIHLVNLECAKNVKIKKEAKRKDQTNFPSIEIDKVEQRKNTAIDERKRLVRAFQFGINEDGLKLYLHLSKTLKTTFEGKNMIVMKDVLISYPYKADNCTVNLSQGMNSSNEKKVKSEEAVSYVKQLVEKFWNKN